MKADNTHTPVLDGELLYTKVGRKRSSRTKSHIDFVATSFGIQAAARAEYREAVDASELRKSDHLPVHCTALVDRSLSLPSRPEETARCRRLQKWSPGPFGKVQYWSNVKALYSRECDLAGCISAVQQAAFGVIDGEAVDNDVAQMYGDDAKTFDEAVSARKRRKAILAKTVSGDNLQPGKRKDSKNVLCNLARQECVVDQSPPVLLHLEGEDTSDRTSWKQALEKVGGAKVSSDDGHQESFQRFVEHLRAEADDRVKDGAPLGTPTIQTFFEQLARIADHAQPGCDHIPGVARRHAPHFLKVELYKLFVERFKDVRWQSHHVPSWDVFEMFGIPKNRNPEDF